MISPLLCDLFVDGLMSIHISIYATASLYRGGAQPVGQDSLKVKQPFTKIVYQIFIV